MTRIKRGVFKRARKKKIIKRAKGFQSHRKTNYRAALEGDVDLSVTIRLKLEFGTEIVHSADSSIVALLGASPGKAILKGIKPISWRRETTQRSASASMIPSTTLPE